MTKGVGIDIIEIRRIKESIERSGPSFLNRLFTKEEQLYCKKFKHAELHFAGRFCAKEAIAKALGTGIGKTLAWTDLEIANNEQGKPYLVITPKLLTLLEDGFLHLSISHTETAATAIAIWSD